MALRLGQINVSRGRLAMDELHVIIVQMGLDILFVQEPYSCGGRLVGLPTTFRCVYECHDLV